MGDNGKNTIPTIIEENDELKKLEMFKNAFGLPETTQDEILEIARKILIGEQQGEEDTKIEK